MARSESSLSGDSVVVERSSDAETPSPEKLKEKLEQEGLSPHRWSNHPNYQYSAHKHNYRKILYVTRGSITFTFPDRNRESITLRAGDRFELAPDISHGAIVGEEGVTCLEAKQT